MDINLSDIFGRFRGRPVVLEEKKIKLFHMEKRELVPPEEKNPALGEMRALAAAMGLRFRVWTPTTTGTKEFYANRVNVSLRPAENGEAWEIARVFDDSGREELHLSPHEVPAALKGGNAGGLAPIASAPPAATPAPAPVPSSGGITVRKPLRLLPRKEPCR